MKKRIDLLINCLRGGGAEKVCVSIANGLANRGYDVRLVILDLTDEVYKDKINNKVKLVVLNKKHARNAGFQLLRYVKKEKPEKFLVFNFELAVVLLLLRKIYFLKFKVIARNINTLSLLNSQSGSNLKQYMVNLLTKFLYNKVDLVIAQSIKMSKDLIDNYKFESTKVKVVNNPVDIGIENFAKSYSKSEYDNKYILFVGRLTKQKGLDYLIEAFNICLKKMPNLKLFIIGKGDLKKELENKVNNLGIGFNVKFIDFTNDIADYYINASATVLSSIYEGFPNVLIESITLGVPVVSFDCPSGPSEIIIDDVNGKLVKYLDTQELANAITYTVNKKWDMDNIKETAKRYRYEYILDQYDEVINLL